MNRGDDKLISFIACCLAAVVIGARQYYKFISEYGFFYLLSPRWGGVIIALSLIVIVGIIGILIFKEGKSKG